MPSMAPKNFPASSKEAIKNPNLQNALKHLKTGFPVKRAEVIMDLPEFDDLRNDSVEIKNHTLENLDEYLEIYEAKVKESGGFVHWARDSTEACERVLDICRKVEANIVTKGKSMVAEEIGLNEFLERNGIKRVETDLGEYIIQLRNEPPSHIIVPAVHVTKQQIGETFRSHHHDLDKNRDLTSPRAITDEARYVLRDKFFQSDVGITGANFLVADSGSSIIVTNEGNGDLTQTLSKIHIVIASIEKIVPTMEDAFTLSRVLARSATGQEFSVYTSISTGPRQKFDLDGPSEYHVILLDNGRSALLGGQFQDTLRCIKCAACMNHCPVYGVVGGHAYGWVYPGPIGAILTPSLIGIKNSLHLPHASTFCGRCEEVCPMRIPIPNIMRHYRIESHERGYTGKLDRFAIFVWGALACNPKMYRRCFDIFLFVLSFFPRKKGVYFKFRGVGRWTKTKALPIPSSTTFITQYRKKR